jgi:hypothetical protein
MTRTLLLITASLSLLAGCSSIPTSWTGRVQIDPGGTMFVSNPPPGISAAWRDGNATMFVPVRNTAPLAARSGGRMMPVVTAGSYFRVDAPPEGLELLLNERWVLLLPAAR